MENGENLSSAVQSSLPGGSKPNKPLGFDYELGLFMFILTTSPESLAFDIGKEVDVADKFDDVVIRVGNEYICIQAKLESNPEENLLDPDVLIGKKPLLNGRFHLLKYFVSYLRINDQFKSSGNKILKKLVIFTNTKVGRTAVNDNDIELIRINESTDTVIPKTHSKAQRYKIKKTSNDLKQYLRKYLKSDSEILSADLAKYFSPFHQFVYDKDSTFSFGIIGYYYQGLIHEGIIEKITEKDSNKEIAKFTKNFIKNVNLSGSAKELRSALIEFIQENTYRKVDEEFLRDKLNCPKLPVSEGKKVEYHKVTPSRLLLQALTNHIIPVQCMSLEVDSFRYYHTALIESVIIAKKVRVKGKGKKQVREGTISEAFIENTESLSNAARKLRKLIPTSIKLHAEKLENYFREAIHLKITGVSEQNLNEVKSLNNIASAPDQKDLKKFLGDVKFIVSGDFGRTKSKHMKISLPCYDVTEENMDDFVGLLEFRTNELSVRDLFQEIKNEKIKDRFLRYYDWNPKHLHREIRDFVEEWKNSGGSTAEGWIVDSKREDFVKKLEIEISRPIANHKTWEYKQNLNQKTVAFDIRFKNDAPFEASYFQTENKIFYIKTDSVLLSAIKMLNYLKEKSEDYVFINVESLVKKEEIMKLANSFHDDKFKSLVLSYESSLGNELEQKLFDALTEILKNHPKKIFIITLVSEDERYKDQFRIVLDKDITLVDLENPSKILEQEVMFQGEPTALNMLINADDVNSLKLVTAKTLDEIFKNKPIRIGCRPFITSDLPGAYAHLSEEVNKKTFLTYLIRDSSENIFVISGMLFQDKDSAKNEFIENLEVLKETEQSSIVLQKVNVYTHPYSIPPSNEVIQIVDSKFDESSFKEFCSNHSEKRVFWVKWDETKFKLQQIYNPDFYMNRKFNKITVEKNFLKMLNETQDQFVFSGIDSNELGQLLGLESSEINQARVFLMHSTDAVRNKFNELSNTCHWLEVETNVNGQHIVWRNSKGSVKSLRSHIVKHHPGNLYQENELLQTFQDKQAVIIADDPGMGKSTTLVKLNAIDEIRTLHWLINVNLRDHLLTIRSINDLDTNGIKQFFSKVSSNLDDNFSQNVFAFGLCAINNPKKPLFITFDGFDEILDEADRMKVISLLRALKEKTCVKFWITTRSQHHKTLEDALSTFSVTFKPLNESEQKRFIIKFFSDRLQLILTEEKFKEIFDDRRHETPKMHEFSNSFLKNMQSVFIENLERFIGTPLQLDLLLGSKGSVEEFKKWTANPGLEPNFDYLGKNVLEVYENFIAGKYETYSKRAGIKEAAIKNLNFEHWLFKCKCLAKSKFFSRSENSLLEHKDAVLAPGLIKSHGKNLEFIHATFSEYFVSEVFVRWMGKHLNPLKQKKLIENILMEDSYYVVRSFINARLSSKLVEPPKEMLREYEKTIEKEFEKHHWHLKSDICFERGESDTPLHIATRECNENIVAFLCSILKNNEDLLKKFVEVCDQIGYTALQFASEMRYYNVIQKLLEPFNNDIKFLKHLLVHSCSSIGVLHAAVRRGRLKTVETLLEPFSGDVDSLKEFMYTYDKTKPVSIGSNFSNAGSRSGTLLHVAAKSGFDQMIEKLLQYFNSKDHKEFLQGLTKTPCDEYLTDPYFSLLIEEKGWTALQGAALSGHWNVVEKLITPFIEDINFLEELIEIQTECKKFTVLHFLAGHKDSGEIIHKLLEPFTNEKREELIGIQAELGNTAVHTAAVTGNDKVMQQLLNYFTESAKEELIKIKTDLGETIFHLAVQSGDSNTVEKALEYFTDKRECIIMEDNIKNSSLHIATFEGHPNIINQLLTKAKDIGDNWKTFKELIDMKNNDGKTAFEIASNTAEINEVLKEFIKQANAEKASKEIIMLLSSVRDDLSSNPKPKRVPSDRQMRLYYACQKYESVTKCRIKYCSTSKYCSSKYDPSVRMTLMSNLDHINF